MLFHYWSHSQFTIVVSFCSFIFFFLLITFTQSYLVQHIRHISSKKHWISLSLEMISADLYFFDIHSTTISVVMQCVSKKRLFAFQWYPCGQVEALVARLCWMLTQKMHIWYFLNNFSLTSSTIWLLYSCAKSYWNCTFSQSSTSTVERKSKSCTQLSLRQKILRVSLILILLFTQIYLLSAQQVEKCFRRKKISCTMSSIPLAILESSTSLHEC